MFDEGISPSCTKRASEWRQGFVVQPNFVQTRSPIIWVSGHKGRDAAVWSLPSTFLPILNVAGLLIQLPFLRELCEIQS